MDINAFFSELLQSISHIEFIEKIEINLEVITIKGRAFLKRKTCFLEIFYNEQTGTTAFALIENNKRIWGIDFDNIRGWHEHTVENPSTHKTISEKGISEIIKEFQRNYMLLTEKE